MMEFGKTLREAREAKGYTIGQLAEVTHIMHQVVEDLEHDNFSRIAAPIYGRGFVKLYCEAVGLDPKPLVAEYMAIQNGERATTIHVRKAPPPPPPQPEPAPQEEAPPEPVPQPVSLFEEPAEPELTPTPAPAPKPAAPQPATPPPAPPKPAVAPFRVPQPLPDPKASAARPALPENMWRIAVVVVAAALLLWAVAVGARALYRATMTAPEEEAAVAEPVKTEAPVQIEQQGPDAKRTPINIPPLYID